MSNWSTIVLNHRSNHYVFFIAKKVKLQKMARYIFRITNSFFSDVMIGKYVVTFFSKFVWNYIFMEFVNHKIMLLKFFYILPPKLTSSTSSSLTYDIKVYCKGEDTKCRLSIVTISVECRKIITIFLFCHFHFLFYLLVLEKGRVKIVISFF